MLILVPAYEPDLRLVQLVREIGAAAPEASILVVDDGSGAAFDGLFQVATDAGAHVLRFATNRGKGAALKSGFAWASERCPGETVVCADCDGQHTPVDILRAAAEVAPGTMVLGGRRFTGNVPARSRFGNTVSRWVFRFATGLAIHDTQTGLRAYPADLLGWLGRVEGTRFEYEANLLFEAKAAGVRVHEIPIETIYLDDNASSHFRPIRDALRIYAPLLRFAGASLASAGLDWAGVLLLDALTGNLLLAVVSARIASAAANFRLNRDLVFADRGNVGQALRRYALLATGVIAANYTLLTLLVDVAGAPLVPAKLAVEALLFLVGYAIQRRSVFRNPASTVAPAASDPIPPRRAAATGRSAP
nr:glycosyltransferase [Propionibacterium sp.]